MPRYKRETIESVYFKWALNYTHQYLINELDEELNYSQDFLGSQLKYFWDYLKFLYNDGISLNDIKAFLKKQEAKIDNSKYRIQLEGGIPVSVFIAVDEIKEVDLMDSKCVVYYREIIIYNKNRRKWSEKKALEIIEKVKDDLEWDGDKAELDHSIDGNALSIEVRVKDPVDGEYIGELN